MAFCGQCGAQTLDDARFCPNCGASQTVQAAPAAPVAQEGAYQQEQQGQQDYQQYQQYQQQGYQQQGYQQQGYQQQYQAAPARVYDPDPDPQALKIGALSVFSYGGLLFLIPLLAAKNSRFARFHAGQGLNLLVAYAALMIGGGILTALFAMITPVLGVLMGIVMWAGGIFLMVLTIIGVINVCKGEMKPLPLIGGIQLIKL